MSKSAAEKHDIVRFDIANYLESEEMIAEYLTEVLLDGDQDELLRAIGHVARARGMTELARGAGIGRESLYKALKPGSHPRFETIVKVLKALGVELRATPLARVQ